MENTATLRSPLALSHAVHPHLVGWVTDLSLLVVAPLVVVVALTFTPAAWDPFFKAFFLYGISTAHLFAGFYYAYKQPEIFSKYRFRLLFVPPFVIALVFALTAVGSKAVLVLLALWRVVHGGRQLYGVMRIYDLKAGDQSAFAKRADAQLAFVGTIAILPYLASAINPEAQWLATLKWVEPRLWGLCFFTATVWLTLSTVRALRGEAFSLLKWLLHVSTIASMYWLTQFVARPFLVFCIIECIHGLQYLVVTWRPTLALSKGLLPAASSGRGNVVGPLTNVAILAVGMIVLQAVTIQEMSLVPHTATVTLLLSARLLHYYFDGFIWKLRELPRGNRIGVAGGTSAATGPLGWSDLALQISFLSLSVAACAALELVRK